MECYSTIKKTKLNLHKSEGVYKSWRKLYSVILFFNPNQTVYMCTYDCVILYNNGETGRSLSIGS